jgi:Mg/Co/Ni transporter MgtE
MAFATGLLPLLLKTVEEVSSRAVAELIEGSDTDDRPSLGRRLLRESAIGLAMGAAGGLLAFAWLQALYAGSVVASLEFAAATAVAILLSAVIGSALGEFALRRSAAGKRVSGSNLTITAMVIGTALYLALAFATGAIVGATGIS